MATWAGIEDTSPSPITVWLSREKETQPWSPLRKVDCRALNDNPEQPVRIEGGRATADPVHGVIWYNFYNSPNRQLIPATWFVKEEKKSKEFILLPLSVNDADKVESLYQEAVSAMSSSPGEDMDKILKEKVILDDPNFKVVVNKGSDGVLSMKKKSEGSLATVFGPVQELQRGYGEYVVEGEKEESILGPVKQLVFVIHGVGEAMWSREDVMLPSIIQHTNRMRTSIHKKQVDEWKRDCEKAMNSKQPSPPPPNRIELLPIEWYDKIHSSSSSLMKSLKASTLRTVPGLRAIANDVLFDVLMYLTPEFCGHVLVTVTEQINTLFLAFQKIHKDFLSNGGKCSLIGYSLGSVIVWDLLSILKDDTERRRIQEGAETKNEPIFPLGYFCGLDLSDSCSLASHPVGYKAYATEDEHANAAENGTWGPSIPKRMSKTIPFVPDFTIFLGSPLGLFLTLRGAHAVFDRMRAASEATVTTPTSSKASPVSADPQRSLTSPFTLPSGAVYNIFHPSDPIAYRIEPLLLPQDFEEADIPVPANLIKEGQGLRLHVKAIQMGDSMLKSFTGRSNSLSGIWNRLAASASTAMLANELEDCDSDEKAELSDSSEVDERGAASASTKRRGPHEFPLGGKSGRVDFQLQTGMIDNQYVSAVSAHASYFTNNDVLDFIVRAASIES